MSFNVKYTFELLDKLSPQLKKVQSNVKQITSKIKGSSIKVGHSFDHMRARLDKFGKKTRDVGKALFLRLTLPVAALGAAFIKAASDAQETSSKFGTVFQDVSKEAEKTANNLAKSFGLSRIKAKELLSDTGDLLTGFGFTGKAALELADKTNQLAVDLASFTNFAGGAEGASKALTKALLGETESVKSLGISILQEDIKKKIAILRSQGMTFESERQAKAIATLQIALDQSKNAIGDYARTSQDFANRMRVLSARFHDFRILLGNIILPLALKLVNVIIRWIEKFNKLSPTVKKIILVVAGLAAVLAPVLITIGFMIPGIIALAAAFKVLTLIMLLNPIGLVVTAIAAAVIGIVILIKKLDSLGISLSEIPNFALGVFQEKFPLITKIILAALAPIRLMKNIISEIFSFAIKSINFISDKIKPLKDFFGFDGDLQAGSQEINQSINSNINQRQDVNVGGQLGININGLPKGSSTNFTPMPGNQMNVGMSTMFAGG